MMKPFLLTNVPFSPKLQTLEVVLPNEQSRASVFSEVRIIHVDVWK